MDCEKKALKEIEETKVLVDYLLYHDLSMDDIKNFSAKTIKIAIQWKREQ